MNISKRFIISLFLLTALIGAGVQTALYAQGKKADEKPSIAETLEKTIMTEGVSAAVKQYRDLKKNRPAAYNFAESELNNLGYGLVNQGRLRDAIEIFKLNVEAFPKAFNTYDSLGEAYMRVGNKKSAVKYYKKSVELNPGNRAGARYVYLLTHYTKKEYMIPMRDGVKLFTQVYAPVDASQKYPFFLFRTPYSVRFYGENLFRSRPGPTDGFVKEGYIFVHQDVRGKFKSEGDFVVMRPHKKVKNGPKDTDESSDTYDTIEWLLKNIPNNNGRVGMWGISYPGWQVVMGMIDPHPALKAASPQASPADMWKGDDFHHNGAFRLMYTFGFLWHVAQTRTGPGVNRAPRLDYGTDDGYKFFLELGPLANANKKYFHGKVPTWNEYMEHGDYDEYWKKQDLLQHLGNIDVPVLNVAGWFDAEDFYGPMGIYNTIEKNNPKNKSTLVAGPWLHGGWAGMSGDSLGNIRFGQNTGVYFREKVQLPFYNYYLKDKGDPNLPEALVFETGSNQWRSYDQWPPKHAVEKKLYFHAGGKLSFTPPEASDPKKAVDAFTSDPADPVPFSAKPGLRQGHLWMVEDQRFAASRPDVLVYQTDVLTEDVTISGPIIADLFISTTGTDADWIVKLIDVYPSDAPDNKPNPNKVRMAGFQMLLAGDVFRGKYRNSFEKPEPLTPGKVTEISYSLLDKCHTFLKGHRIMVQVQSSWFPVIDRNPQKFTDIYSAKAEDFQKAVHSMHRSPKSPSHLKLLVTSER